MRVKALGHVFECASVSVYGEWSYNLVTIDGRKFIIDVNIAHERNGKDDFLLEKLAKEGFLDFDAGFENDDFGYDDYYLVNNVMEEE